MGIHSNVLCGTSKLVIDVDSLFQPGNPNLDDGEMPDLQEDSDSEEEEDQDGGAATGTGDDEQDDDDLEGEKQPHDDDGKNTRWKAPTVNAAKQAHALCNILRPRNVNGIDNKRAGADLDDSSVSGKQRSR